MQEERWHNGDYLHSDPWLYIRNQLGEPTVTVPDVTDTTVVLKSFAVAGLPSAGTAGKVVYCTNGDGGSPCLAVDNGSAWLRVNLGSAVSATDADEYLTAE